MMSFVKLYNSLKLPSKKPPFLKHQLLVLDNGCSIINVTIMTYDT